MHALISESADAAIHGRAMMRRPAPIHVRLNDTSIDKGLLPLALIVVHVISAAETLPSEAVIVLPSERRMMLVMIVLHVHDILMEEGFCSAAADAV